MEVEFFRYRFHGDVCPDSYDVDKAASSASSYYASRIRQYNLFGPNEDHEGKSYPNYLNRKGFSSATISSVIKPFNLF